MVKLRAKPPEEAKARKPISLVYSQAGIGKTHALTRWKKPYYIDCEGGASRQQYLDSIKESGGAYMGPEDGANDMAVVIEQLQALAQLKHDFLNVIIDSGTKLFNTAVSIRADEMEEAGRDMDKTFGAEKKGAIRGMRSIVRWIERCDMGAMIVCHEKTLWKDSKEVGSTFDCWDKLAYELDLVLHVTKQGNARKAKVMKTRIMGFPENDVFDWNYETFAKKYGMETMEKTPELVTLATEQQVAAILALLKVVRVEEETILKWFDKAGVEDWSEMDIATIAKCIDHLTSKLPKSAA
jgi:hypothetical protein